MRALNGNKAESITFSPHLSAADPWAAYWLRQVTVRLRREICWCRYERGTAAGPGAATLPPFIDKASESLGMQRYWEEKKKFFASDATAKYLGQQLEEPCPGTAQQTGPGSFGWVVGQLDLDPTAAFVLALGLAGVFDSAVGSVVSACLNDPMKTHPTLALAQKLWDQPEQVLALADPSHPLFRFGLLQPPSHASTADPFSFIQWDTPISVPALVANQLLSPLSSLPPALSLIEPPGDGAGINEAELPNQRQVCAALNSKRGNSLRILPISGIGGTAHREIVRLVARLSGKKAAAGKHLPGLLEDGHYLKTLVTLCWLKGIDLYLGEEAAPLLTRDGDPQRPSLTALWISLQSIPVTIYLNITLQRQLNALPPHLLLPKITVPSFTFQQRRALWKELLGAKAKGLQAAINECSRRFRYEKETVRRIAEGVNALPGTLSKDDLIAACRAHLKLDLGDLAQTVTPRFKEETLILPHKQHRQFQEVMQAMRSLTQVHYEWGTARAWNESGISVLFAGPPGTGKTMAAEILAQQLDLPIFRIDLSQVVNKYIGETEKNLKRLFDAADISDMVLFFDEADSLFGKRTEVKDAHDRYANLEVSYLLERMERFKGLAILATNRKKDLDEAFLRRLRYIIDFPFPGTRERRDIWLQVIPRTIDRSGIDIEFLARQFQLTGGHIRSIVFNACLQAAQVKAKTRAGLKGVLTMEQMIAAVKREFDKMGRSVTLEHFGPHAKIIEEMEKKK